MRIDRFNNIEKIYNTTNQSKTYDSTETSSSTDQVDLSTFAKDLAVAKKAVNQTSDVRTDKVESIKEQMEAGTYNVSAVQIADHLISKAKEI